MHQEPEFTHTILVIDDETNMLALLERILTLEGYRVLLASDGAYGINLLRENNPDLVLLDIIMPGPDGFTVLGRIREHSGVPVIMLTALKDTESIQATLDSGADDYIKKPFRPNELLARIRTRLTRFRQL